MTTNGKDMPTPFELMCYCGHLTVLPPPPTGGGATGACARCGRKYSLDNTSGTIVADWSAIFKKVLLLDFDGTIRYAKGMPFPLMPDDVGIFPDVIPVLARSIENGFFVVGITNQAGPAFGQGRLIDIQQALGRTVELLEGHLHMVQASFGHPEATVESFRYRSLLRKPLIGMLAVVEFSMMSEAGMVPDWDKSLLVGDGESDLELAKAAGIPFVWAHEFFGRPHPSEGRSPECFMCRGESEDHDPRPTIDAEFPDSWIHVELPTGGLVPCKDEDWFIGRRS